jgi:hypothetical protein
VHDGGRVLLNGIHAQLAARGARSSQRATHQRAPACNFVREQGSIIASWHQQPAAAGTIRQIAPEERWGP